MGRAAATAMSVVALAGLIVTGVSLADFERVLESIPVVDAPRVTAALSLAFSTEGFPADETYSLLERLRAAPGTAAEKEAIVLVFARAMEQGIPIASLLSKTTEGLARNVQLAPLGQLLEQRLRLLVEGRDLFHAKGIFRAMPGAAPAAPVVALPVMRFDALLTEFGDALGDYLESGGSPFNGNLIHNEVTGRLTRLRGVALPASDVDLLLSRIVPADLTRIVQTALG